MLRKIKLSILFSLLITCLLIPQYSAMAQEDLDFKNHKIATIGINNAIIQTTAWQNFSKESGLIKSEIKVLTENLQLLKTSNGNDAKIAETNQEINIKTNKLEKAYITITNKLKEQLFLILQDIYKEYNLTLLINTDVGSSILIFAKKSDLTTIASKRLDERTIDFKVPIL